jgi:hypothetical protein
MLINSTNFVNFFLENFARNFNRIRQGCVIAIKPKKEKNKNLRLFTFNWGAKNQKQKKTKKQKNQNEKLLCYKTIYKSPKFSNQIFLFKKIE